MGRVRAHAALRRPGDRALAGDRLSGRLLRLAPRARAGEGRAAGPAGGAVLDLLPDADVRLDEPAGLGRLRGAGAQRALDRHAVLRGRPARRRRLARRPADRGDHGPGLRLRAVPDPAALRVAGPDRPAHDRGRARPRRLARAGLPARRAAAVEGRDAGRDRADRAADVRRLLHARPDVRVAGDVAARQHDQQLRAGRAGQGAGRRADAAAERVPARSSCSITCGYCGGRTRHDRDHAHGGPARDEAPSTPPLRPRRGHVDLRRVVAAARAAGDPLRVQRGPLAHVHAGLLAALVLDRSDAERAQRPDAVERPAALARARRAGDADRHAAGRRAGDRAAALARSRRGRLERADAAAAASRPSWSSPSACSCSSRPPSASSGSARPRR